MVFQALANPPPFFWNPFHWGWWYIEEFFWFLFCIGLILTIIFGFAFVFFPKQCKTSVVLFWFLLQGCLVGVWTLAIVPFFTVTYAITCFLTAKLWNRIFATSSSP